MRGSWSGGLYLASMVAIDAAAAAAAAAASCKSFEFPEQASDA